MFILIAFIFLLSACKPKEQPVLEKDIHKGNDGLLLSFAKNMPPDDITDKVTFQMGIELRNRGAENIEKDYKGYLTLLNFYPEEMSLKDESKTKTFELEGKNIYNSEGGFNMLTFTIENRGLAIKQRKEENFLFKAFSCYRYKTT